MLSVATTPFSALLGLFFVVPLGIVCSICAADCVSSLRHRRERQRGIAAHRVNARR